VKAVRLVALRVEQMVALRVDQMVAMMDLKLVVWLVESKAEMMAVKLVA
jgi:hypothetical protein